MGGARWGAAPEAEGEMGGDRVHFCTGSQRVSLRAPGLDSAAGAPVAPRKLRLAQTTVAVMAVTLVSSLVALIVVVLQKPGSPPLEPVQQLQAATPGDKAAAEQLPAGPHDPHRSDGLAELQETIQMFKSHVENSNTWSTEIRMLTCRVDNVSSQIQVLSGHLEDASADIQMVKGILQDANTLSFQTQMLRSSMEGASAEIQKLKGDLENANALNSQTHSFLKNSLENASIGLHMLSGGLGNTNTEIAILKAGLKMANAQAQWANSSLKNANAQIHVLRGQLASVDDLRAENQVLRSSLEGANAEIQRVKGSMQNANALNSQTQTFLRGSLDNTSSEIQLLRGHFKRTGDEILLLKRDLETITAQTQVTSNHLEQTDAQIQLLKTELENANALDPKIQVLSSYLKNASSEIQTLKQRVEAAASLVSKTQMLESNLQKANAENQQLKWDLENTKTLIKKIQEKQNGLETIREALGSQEQLQRTQNQLLHLILQGWKAHGASLYYFSHVKKSWHEAERFCVSQGAHLASVTSEEEQTFLTQFTSVSHHWIGLTDGGHEGVWRWVDGTPFSAGRSPVLGQPSARQLAARGRPDGGLRPHAEQVERHALRHPLSLGVQEAHRPTRGLRRARREGHGHCQPWPPPHTPCGDCCAQPAPRGSPFGPLCPLLALSFSPAHLLTSHDPGGPRAPPGQGLLCPRVPLSCQRGPETAAPQ
uniref:C-type lectin domain family 4 member F isoform X1 n=1 Tax=Nyctereutes procyonoides TaxID=34880 RepID=UPI00244507BE|nr:C-type lectin domain family 4 member F isoform X1 [Nyctereutes procyonoides]